jgi:hypothetical protein
LIFAPLENCSDVRDNVRDSDARTVESKIRSTEESMSVSTGMEPGQKAGEKGEKDKEGEEGKGERDGEGKGKGEGKGTSIVDGEEGGINLTPISPAPQQPSDGGWTLDLASTIEFKESSQRDLQFWDAVAARKNKSKNKRSRKYSSTPNREGQFSISDEMGRSNDSDSGSFLKVSSSEMRNLGHGLGPVPLGKIYVFTIILPLIILFCFVLFSTSFSILFSILIYPV